MAEFSIREYLMNSRKVLLLITAALARGISTVSTWIAT
jgi:hypothetical protein